MFGEKVFDSPKPVQLIAKCIGIGCDEDGIVLDFFAGSGTTAHAVVEMNVQDGGHRKFILVQLPEPTGREDYPTIAEIAKERVRRVIKKLESEQAGKLDLERTPRSDLGFRVFKLSESNFAAWEAQRPETVEALQEQLEVHVEHIRAGRRNDDLLYEILLKSGFPLTAKVEPTELADKKVFSVAEGALVLCLDRGLTLELIRMIAEKGPARVVCLDDGFAGNDQLKANAVQIFKAKGITSFKTV